ncbi:coiled-coil domain-containing protein [Micromonospora sediminicola]|uniref:coiled-coil domain-containing protein n=1 Tax=Micromonospora sediminicola TaxID=946078 RepID=UPI0033EC4562
MTAPLRRWLTPVVAVLAALAVLAGPTPASAALGTAAPNPSGHSEDDDPPLISEAVTAANRAYLQAKSKLDTSRKRQLQLALEVKAAQNQLDALSPQVSEIAAQSYRTGRVGAMAMLLESDSPDSFVQRASALDELNLFNAQRLAAINEVKGRAERAKIALDAEVREQEKQANAMAREKVEAQKALKLVGGLDFTGGLVSATSPVAKIGPGRTADGGWKSESCSENDPTTSGCVTPRTLHAYKEVKRAGFNRFVGCYRPGGPWEHPKGKACDWSLQNSGFAPWHNNDTRRYGNEVAAFLIRNADRLGIYYVIWNRQIWFPATGWSSYSGPSNHTDHVHMSLL